MCACLFVVAVVVVFKTPESFWSLLSAEFKPHGDVNSKPRKQRGGGGRGSRAGADDGEEEPVESVAQEASSLGDMIRNDKSDYSTVRWLLYRGWSGCLHWASIGMDAVE